MKTTNRTNSSLPTPFRFSVYIFAVAVLCFINWTALKASDPADSESLSIESRLIVASIEEPEPEIQLEDWMLTFADEYMTDNAEQEIALESWMFNYDVFCSVDFEDEQSLKEWMVNTTEWSRKKLLAEK